MVNWVSDRQQLLSQAEVMVKHTAENLPHQESAVWDSADQIKDCKERNEKE